jgi:hypothetical protein
VAGRGWNDISAARRGESLTASASIDSAVPQVNDATLDMMHDGDLYDQRVSNVRSRQDGDFITAEKVGHPAIGMARGRRVYHPVGVV